MQVITYGLALTHLADHNCDHYGQDTGHRSRQFEKDDRQTDSHASDSTEYSGSPNHSVDGGGNAWPIGWTARKEEKQGIALLER